MSNAQFDAGTTVFCELAFTDRFGNPVTPTGVTLKVIDATNGLLLLPETSYPPPVAPNNTLEIPISVLTNLMSRPKPSQTMQVVVKATLPDSSQVTMHGTYLLNNPALIKTTFAQ